MAQPVSITDVAGRAGVSVGTVSNVLNRPQVVAPPTRKRVLEAVRELGFVRNESARHLRAGQSRTIGLVVLDIANPFFTDVARGVEDVASEAGLSVILCNSDGDADKECRYLNLLAEQRVQGILIVPATTDGRRMEDLRDRGIPVVLLDRRASRSGQCSVSVDDVAGGRLAVEHLIERGHQRIAFVGGSDARQVKDRRRGALDATQDAGGDVRELVMIEVGALNAAGGRTAGRELLSMDAATRPTAAFCANDLLALGLLQELTRAGIPVPGVTAIVGYDDIEFAEAAAVPLSSIRQPRHELGRAAATLLAEEASGGPHRHSRLVFAPELVMRASSAAPASSRANEAGGNRVGGDRAGRNRAGRPAPCG
ncbi:MAG: LacI family DNA-binding transcriptional regulator [Acidimicrobiales bacterium]